MDVRWIWGGWGNESLKEATETIYFDLSSVHTELETTGINANFLPDI